MKVKDWNVVCLTCRENEIGRRWELKTENQAEQIKAIHQTINEGHKVRVAFDG